MRSLQLLSVFSLSLTFVAQIGLAELSPSSDGELQTIQTPRPKLVLVSEGDLYKIYRPQNEAELKAAADAEAARLAEIEAEKTRLVEQLLLDQAKGGQETVHAAAAK